MNFKKTSLSLALILSTGASFAVAQTQITNPTSPPTTTTSATPPDTSDTMTTNTMSKNSITVTEDVLVPLSMDTPHHLFTARNELMQKDYKSAAKELRKASALVRLEMLRATPEAKVKLSATESELTRLANQVESGKNIDMQMVQETFANAELALARHHNLKAQQYSSLNQNGMVGQEIQAAVMSLQNGLLWSGQRFSRNDLNTLNNSNTLASSLINGTAQTRDRMDKDLQTTSGLINKYHDQALNALSLTDVENE